MGNKKGFVGTLAKYKMPIIAGYVAGWLMALFNLVSIQGNSTIDITVILASFIWFVTILTNITFFLASTVAAIIVGVLTWFALRK